MFQRLFVICSILLLIGCNTTQKSGNAEQKDTQTIQPRGKMAHNESNQLNKAAFGDLTGQVSELIGQPNYEVLAMPEKVESFRVVPKFFNNSMTLDDLQLEKQGRDLNPAQIGQVTGWLFDEQSYIFEPSKRCPFEAQEGLSFHRNGQRVEVLFSYSCKKLYILGPGGRGIEDIDPIAKDIELMMQELLR